MPIPVAGKNKAQSRERFLALFSRTNSADGRARATSDFHPLRFCDETASIKRTARKGQDVGCHILLGGRSGELEKALAERSK